MSSHPKHLYEFGPFCLDADRPRLTRNGEIVSLTPKALQILSVLVENNGTVVAKEDLMQQVWPNVFVEESNLSVHIFNLRKALGEQVEAGNFIETEPRRGYRFTAPVRTLARDEPELVIEKHTVSTVRIEEATETEPSTALPAPAFPALSGTPRWLQRKKPAVLIVAFLVVAGLAGTFGGRWLSSSSKGPATTAEVRSMAVLPFKMLNAEADSDYLGLGIADSLITQLGNARRVVVRPTSATRKYSQNDQDPLAAGRELGVETVLEGNIQRDGERLRVTARLLRVADGATLWGGTFSEKFTDIFRVQDSISSHVTNALLIDLTSDEKQLLVKRYTANTEAYLEYLKGRYFWNRRTASDAENAIKHFERAIALDPNYALAYSGLADCYAIRTALPPTIAIPKAMAAAQKAVDLDHDLAEGHVSLGTIKELYEWDREGAEREYKLAVTLNPNYALAHGIYGLFLTGMGRFEEGASEVRRAEEIDPLSPSIHIYAGWNFYNARLYDRSIAEAQKAIELDPNVSMAYNILARAYAGKKMYAEAIDSGKKASDMSDEKLAMMSKEHPLSLASLGYAYAVAGQTVEARKILHELQDLAAQTYVSPGHLAVIHAGLGENDLAFAYLEKTYQERDEMQRFIGVSPIFESLHADPRFAQMLRRVGFTTLADQQVTTN
jgi:DNA-binding winged helix-turn-helix (wHTH) protein/TolB-like protein/Tfp pilus assembly protein PilF